MPKKRDYVKERRAYYGYGPASGVTSEQRANRRDMRARQVARQKVKETRSIPRNHEVHHQDGNPQNNTRSNLKVISRGKNRAMNKK